MKKKHLFHLTLSGVLAAGLTFCGPHLFAQDQAPAPPPDQTAPQPTGQAPSQGQVMGHHHHRGANPDRALARMTKRYNLSEEQQNQIKPILTDEQQQMQAIGQDQSLAAPDKRAKRMSIHTDANSKIEAILNDQQKQQFTQDQQHMQERMQERRQRQGAAPGSESGTPPPPPPPQ